MLLEPVLDPYSPTEWIQVLSGMQQAKTVKGQYHAENKAR